MELPVIWEAMVFKWCRINTIPAIVFSFIGNVDLDFLI